MKTQLQILGFILLFLFLLMFIEASQLKSMLALGLSELVAFVGIYVLYKANLFA